MAKMGLSYPKDLGMKIVNSQVSLCVSDLFIL